MLPSLNSLNYVNPILKRSFSQTFDLNNVERPLEKSHLTMCYQRHEQGVIDYFQGRDCLLNMNIIQPESLSQLLDFLNLAYSSEEYFPHLNIGKLVDNWNDIKHKHKINPNTAGREGRKFFDYCR
jgi:hypothetical protein